MDLSSLFHPQEFQGLTPQSWICVGAGYSREEIKASLLKQGVSFVGDAVQTFPGLLQRIAGVSSNEVLSSTARQEVLRLLLSQPGFRERFLELRRLKRQGSFFRRLDLAIQAGRMSFAHWEEAEVFSERLNQRFGENPVRAEVQSLAFGYEVWLEQRGYYDPPRVVRQAVERLHSGLDAQFPKKIFYFTARASEALEEAFWNALGSRVEVVSIRPEDLSGTSGFGSSLSPRVTWERWHTLDDAADQLAEQFASALGRGQSLSESVVIFHDIPATRRSLKRALEHWGVKLADPRDPTRVRWDEQIKRALLPLEIVARGFERSRVISYVNQLSSVSPGQRLDWVREIQARGIQNGLASYAGGKLIQLHAELSRLQAQLGGAGKKKTALGMGQAHLEVLNTTPELLSWFENLWKQLAADFHRVDLGDRKAAPMFWLERLQQRIAEASPPVEKLKPEGGLDVYRFQQAPTRAAKKLVIFGMPGNWLNGEGVGDYWFSEREREVLASEFGVRSAIQIRKERTAVLRAWLRGAEEILFLDSSYSPEGRERESVQLVLDEVRKWNPNWSIPQEYEEKGSHPRWSVSFSALRPVPSQSVQLAPLSAAQGLVLSASTIENYSRCPFLALARNRWRLDDLSEPETELWPQVKGIVLHEAVRLLVESRDENGNFGRTPEECIDEAWKLKRPQGLLQGARIEVYCKRRLAGLLRVFQGKEREYVQRAGTQVLSLEGEGLELMLNFGDFSVRGKPDRIDEHPDGLWVIDYKTSSSAPHGSAMVENGYRLQLPFYALAVQEKLGKKALGVQFVQLDKKGTRSNGVFFPAHNGKEPGKLTNVKLNAKSLIQLPPEEVWSQFHEQIEAQGKKYIAGEYDPLPRIAPRKKECEACAVSDLCGFKRLIEETVSGGDESDD